MMGAIKRQSTYKDDIVMKNTYHRIVNGDIEGIDRYVVGFNKIPDEDGENLSEVKYKLEGITLNKLQKIFNVDINTEQRIVFDVIGPLDINASQAELLNPYVVGGQIDVNKYFFELRSYQAPGYDWSKGYAIKIEDK